MPNKINTIDSTIINIPFPKLAIMLYTPNHITKPHPGNTTKIAIINREKMYFVEAFIE